MSITVTEKFESRKSTKGDNPSAELVYTVRGTNDDLAARNSAETTSPATYDGHPRQSVSVEPVGDMVAALASESVELRLVPSPAPLYGAWEHSFHFSGIRLSNSIGWPAP